MVDMERMIEEVQDLERRVQTAKRLQKDYAVFLSYSRLDHSLMLQVKAVLDRCNISYRLDEKDLELGDHIIDKVVACIEECTHYLLIVTPASVGASWCITEHGIAVGMKKTVIFFLASTETTIPPWAQPYLGTTDLAELEDYFGRQLIDPRAVEKLIRDVFGHLPKGGLAVFEPAGPTAEGRYAWDAPNRKEIEGAKPDPASLYLDDCRRDHDELVCRVEMDDDTLVLHCQKEGCQPTRHVLSHNVAVGGVVASPGKDGSEIIGSRVDGDDGRTVYSERPPSTEDWFSRDKHARKPVYGWVASPSFWKVTMAAIKAALPSPPSKPAPAPET